MRCHKRISHLNVLIATMQHSLLVQESNDSGHISDGQGMISAQVGCCKN